MSCVLMVVSGHGTCCRKASVAAAGTVESAAVHSRASWQLTVVSKSDTCCTAAVAATDGTVDIGAGGSRVSCLLMLASAPDTGCIVIIPVDAAGSLDSRMGLPSVTCSPLLANMAFTAECESCCANSKVCSLCCSCPASFEMVDASLEFNDLKSRSKTPLHSEYHCLINELMSVLQFTLVSTRNKC